MSRWFGYVLRLELSESSDVARVLRVFDDESTEQLLDATRELDSPLGRLGRDVSSVEPLSHVLFWSADGAVELLEMPRLQLRFRFRTGPVFEGATLTFKKKLYCEAYGGPLAQRPLCSLFLFRSWRTPRSDVFGGVRLGTDPQTSAQLPICVATSLFLAAIRSW